MGRDAWLTMRKDNPAIFQCPKGKSKLHTWKRLDDGRAQCQNCKLVLNKVDADDTFREC